MSGSKKILSAAAAAGAAIGLTCVVNKFIFYVSTMKKLLSSDHSGIFKWRFGDIYYTKSGQGSPLLLIHDLNSTSSSYEWKMMIERLSKNHTVYALDLLGCGHSAKPKLTYTNYLYVQLLSDFVKEVIKGRTDVIASHAASPLAVMACHVEPNLYRKLMMINPQLPSDIAKVPRLHHKFLKYVIELPAVGTLIYNILNAFYAIQHTFIKKYFNLGELVDRNDVRAYYEAAHTGGASSRFLYASIRARYTNIPIFKAVKDDDHSIVIVCGGALPEAKAAAEAYTALNPAIEVATLENAKYLPQLQLPEQLEEIIDIYLSNVS